MTQEPKECPVCDIAAAFAVAKGICQQFRESGLDCSEFLKTLDDPEGKASDSVKALLALSEDCKLPAAKEMLDYLVKAGQLDSLEFVAEKTPPGAPQPAPS